MIDTNVESLGTDIVADASTLRTVSSVSLPLQRSFHSRRQSTCSRGPKPQKMAAQQVHSIEKKQLILLELD